MFIADNEARKGFIYALICYVIWGIFPLYWYPLNQAGIGADQLLAQRITWSSVFSVIILLLSPYKREFFQAITHPKTVCVFILSACAISMNWLTYLWAIMNHHVLDASLGYFITPLFNIFLGWLIFKEKINRLQFVAILLAMIGITWLAIPAGQIPWISLFLAFTFGIYSLIRKLAPLGALTGLVLETLVLLPFALGYLWYCKTNHQLVFGQLTTLQTTILVGSGLVTVIPLIAFAASAKRIPLSLIGIIQYLSPTMQTLIGLLFLNEAFNLNKLIGYTWVWLGVMIYLYAIWRGKHIR